MKTFLSKNSKSIQNWSLAIALANALAACGSQTPNSAPVGSNNGQMPWSNNTSCFTNPFSPGCPAGGGPLANCTLVANVKDANNLDLRKYLCYPLVGYSGIGQNPAPFLSPDEPSGQYFGGNGNKTALMTMSYVRPGDKVTFSASGGYNFSTKNFVFITDCKKISLNTTTNGLWASDGKKAYPMPSGSSFVVENEGNLRIGFNFDSSATFSCTALSSMNFTVQHCEEANGTTHACP